MKSARGANKRGVAKPRKSRKTLKPVLLAGGNPQIAKADGDAPVQAYIAAMPGWKRDVGRRLDALIVRTLPDVRKAVRWNSPLYGLEGQGWFLSVRCLTKAVKLAFFQGASLRPLPPGESKNEGTRYLDIREDDPIDETLLASWIRQASALPGWDPKRSAGSRDGAEVMGVKSPKDELARPQEFIDALGADPALEAAFEALTPGRQRGYVLHFSDAKQSKTRVSRIEKSAPRILDGKGRHDR